MTWLRTDGMDALESISGCVMLVLMFKIWVTYG
jgi:hypothetical protein